MNVITKTMSVAVLFTLGLSIAAWAAEPPKPKSPPDGALPPYGHADFYPSPERPIGWRADGSGAFPGARPVTYWTEGKPIRVDTANHEGTKHTVTTLPTPVPVNILWKTVLRGWANNQPIVIGKRLITTAEPHWLICLDAETGQVLWERRNSPFELMGLPPDEVQALDEYLAMFYTARMIPATMLGNYSDLKVGRVQQDLEYWKRQLATSQQILERLVANNKYGANAKDALAKVKEALPLMDDPKANAQQIKGALRGFVWHLGTEWLQKRFRMWGVVHWDAWMGWTFATPVSDGQYIYASMGQGQAVCYDLQGNRRWGVFLPFDPKRAGRGCVCLHCSSPLLADNVLLVQGISDLFGLDARTGAVLWRATNARRSYSDFTEVGSHSVLRLPSRRAVVATTSGAVFDVKTGTQVGDLGARRRSIAGMVSTGNVIPLQTGPEGGSSFASHLTGIRLDDGPDGSVVCTRLWDIPMTARDNSPILHNGIYYGSNVGAVGDVRTGTRWDDAGVAEWARVLVGYSSSPILAGDCLVGNDGGNAYVAAPYPHVVAKEMRVAQVVRPGFARLLSAGLFVSAGARPRDERVAQYNPEWAEKGWLNDSGLPAQFGNGSPSAHGDRLYFRTTAALICIGPSVKGTPADDPAQAIRIREAATPEAVLEFLGSKSDQYRYEACRTLGRLARSGVAARDAQEKLAALVTKDRHPDVRAAAIEALDAGDPAAKPGQALLKACLLEMSGKSTSGKTPAWERSDAGATLRALGEGYVVAALLPMITGDADRAAQATATAILAVADVRDTRVRDALIANLRRQVAVEDRRNSAAISSADCSASDSPALSA